MVVVAKRVRPSGAKASWSAGVSTVRNSSRVLADQSLNAWPVPPTRNLPSGLYTATVTGQG
jgi:hypothetical protein